MRFALPSYIKNLGNKKLSLVISIAVGVVILTLMTFMKVGGVGTAVLYSDLEMAERNEITHFLDRWGKSYSVEEDDIMVPESEVREIRMMLASEGLPSTGSIVGYEIFNKSESLGTSGFTQNVNLIRALEGELGRTIMSFDKIRKARVHLVIPKRELFSQNRQNPTASVVLKLGRPTVGLSKQEIEAIAYLVASSVPGLEVGGVAIVTTEGQALRLPGEDGLLSLSLQEYKIDLEHRLRDSVENLVEKTLGAGKVRAEVTAEVDFDQIVIDSELYDPDGQVVRSTQTIKDQSNSREGSETSVSVGNNVPNADQGENSESAHYVVKERLDETVNYEISKEKRKHVKASGEISKLSLAVLVDGDYVLDESTGTKIYKPLDDQVMRDLRLLISSAVGLQKSRGDMLEIVNMRFFPVAEVPEESWLDREAMYELIKLAVIAVITFLIALLVIKPLIQRFLDASFPSVEPGALDGQGDDADGSQEVEQDPEEGKTSLEILNELVAENPDGAVEMLRSLIKTHDPEEGEGGA